VVREYAGKDLELISDAEGTTGLITRVTLKVRPNEDLVVKALALPSAESLAAFCRDANSQNLPLWSVIFINPKMAELKNESPVRTHFGHDAEHKVALPKAYILLLAYRQKDHAAMDTALPALLKSHGARLLSDEIAAHEWENRFKLMIVKRLGPSLVPAEIVVPLENLGRALDEIERKLKQPIVKEGVIVRNGRGGKPEAVILGFIPSDQRKFSYNFVFGLVLTIVKIAEKYGGRAYSTGLYFTGRAKQVLGSARAVALKAHQKAVDPSGLLNPDKVFGGRLVGKALGLGMVFEPLIRPFGNAVGVKSGSDGSPSAASRPTSPGTLTPVPNAGIASTNATSSTAAAGKASRREASGTGSANIWRAGPNGTRRWSTRCWSARPANCATIVVPPRCRSNRAG
jgi:FAD/FMN-containing dehydrogenase